MNEVDFLVIGSGSGLDVANAAVQRDWSVAVVEKGPLGGTCLNRGCIPSKLPLYHADVLETIERADEFDIDAEVNGVDFERIVQKVDAEVSADADSLRQGLSSSPDHDLYEGTGRFVDDRTVEVVDGPDEGATIRAETVLIAAETRPAITGTERIRRIRDGRKRAAGALPGNSENKHHETGRDGRPCDRPEHPRPDLCESGRETGL